VVVKSQEFPPETWISPHFTTFNNHIEPHLTTTLNIIKSHYFPSIPPSPGSYRSCSIALDSGTSGALAAPSWLARRLAQQLTDCGDGEGKRLGFRLEDGDGTEMGR